MGFDIRWLVVDDSASVPESMRLLSQIHSAGPARIAATVCDEGCKEAVGAAEGMQSAYFADVVQRLLGVNMPVAIIPSINRLPLANATTNYFFGGDILLMQVRSNVQRVPSRIIKRLFDIVVSSFLLALLAPLFILLSIAIKRSSRNPVMFSQKRIGRHGALSQRIKFRTMVMDAEGVLRRWAMDNPELYLKSYKLREEPRITPVGKWLRKTSLDDRTGEIS